MREVEFRAWLKSEKKIVDVKSIDFIEKEISYIEIKGTKVDLIAYESFNDIELMQYTGLIDRIGTKIYEGDIIKICGKTFNNRVADTKAIVVFEDAQFAFYMNERFYKIWGDSCEMYEVIGNIYENKELLKNV